MCVSTLALAAIALPVGAAAAAVDTGGGASAGDAKRATATSPCKFNGKAPCGRLVRSTSRGRTTPGQRVTVSGRTVLRRAGAVIAGRPVYLRLDGNAGTRKRLVQLQIRRIPGLTQSHIRIGKRGMTKCAGKTTSKWIVIRCRRGTRARGTLVVKVSVPRGSTAKSIYAVARFAGTTARGVVVTRIQKAPLPPPPPPPPDPLGNVSAALCPTGLSFRGVPVALVEAVTVNPGNRDPNTSGSFNCRYESTYRPGVVTTKTNVLFTYLRQAPLRPRFCGISPTDPAYANSSTHEIQVYVDVLIDGADGVRSALLARLEAESIGFRC